MADSWDDQPFKEDPSPDSDSDSKRTMSERWVGPRIKEEPSPGGDSDTKLPPTAGDDHLGTGGFESGPEELGDSLLAASPDNGTSSPEDLDRKPAAREEIHHLDAFSPQYFESSDETESANKRQRTTRRNSGASFPTYHDPPDQFVMDLGQFDSSSPGTMQRNFNPPPPELFEGAAVGSPHYAYVHPPPVPPVASLPPQHYGSPSLQYRAHPGHPYHYQMMQSMSYSSPPPHPPHPPHHPPPPIPAPEVERQPATSTGEHSSQFRRGPSQAELEAARTARARQALQTWYRRLEDLYRYKLENGDCK
jgi:hypothetical protein